MLGVWLVVSLVLLAQGSSVCRYAETYNANELLANATQQAEFINDMMYWEGQFHQPYIGYNPVSGLTFDGHPINQTSGQPCCGGPHPFSAASKESVHVSLLALALQGNADAISFFAAASDTDNTTEFIIEILSNKISSYEGFNETYPGFGGYLPWFTNDDSGIVLLSGWTNSTPALDNGELVWGLIAATQALEAAGLTDLAIRYQNWIDMMAANSVLMFNDGNGRIRAVVGIKNVSLAPTDPGQEYSNDPPNASYFLDDPYEGELFVFFCDLFGSWENQTARDAVWEYKRRMLEAVNLTTPAGNITVERGFWYSSHEKWKYMMMPYTDSPILKRLFLNGEKARTWYSAMVQKPGIAASCNDVSTNENIPDYAGAVGIQEIAFESIEDHVIISPYGAFPVILADQGVGLVWYQNMLLGPRMQGPLGSTEAVNVSGTAISPVTTWDSKVTTVLATLGGVTDYARSYMQRGNGTAYERFLMLLEQEWSPLFGATYLPGQDFSFELPTAAIPMMNPTAFTDCV